MYKIVRWLWLGALEIIRKFGLDDVQILRLRKIADAAWNKVSIRAWRRRLNNVKHLLQKLSIRILQRLLGRCGVSIGAAVPVSEVIRLATLIRPVSFSSELIRLGEPTDGGYLVPDDLEGVVSCFSPGVAEAATFELALAKLGINSYLADFSVDGPPFQDSMLDFEKKFIGIKSDDAMYIRLDDWVRSKHHVTGDLMLQMDIEGAEWAILADISQETLAKFRVIVIELHDLDQMMTTVSGSRIVESVFSKLLERFLPVHLHPNNCSPPTRYRGIDIPPVIEVTFVRKDRLRDATKGIPVTIPHPLDAKNVEGNKDVNLPEYWYVASSVSH